MPVNWDEMHKVLSPIKGYADLRKRWQVAFSYPFVRETYNFTMDEIADYTRRLLEKIHAIGTANMPNDLLIHLP